MAKEGRRKNSRKRLYDIAVVSLGEARRTRNFRLSRVKLILLLVLGFLASVGVTMAVLVYTPLAMYVPIPNPGLEERYGKQIVETQQRLNGLAEEMLMLKGYNLQLRRALGEDSTSSPQRVTKPSRGQRDVEVEAESPVPWNDVEASGRGGEYNDGGVIRANQIDEGGALPPFPLLRPTEGFVSQGFDPQRNHFGMDFAAKRGSAVYAAADGRVVFAGWTYDDGNMLIVSHVGGYMTVYKHNQALLATTQMAVKRGEPVALLGTSGTTSEGPHLHFEVWRNGVPQDPEDFFFSPLTTP